MNPAKCLLAIPLSLAISGCQPSPATTAPNHNAPPNTQATHPAPQAVLWVRGLACPFCTYNIERQLRTLPGVLDVNVTLATGRITATLTEDNPPTRQQIMDAVKNTGFTLDRIQMP